MSKKTEALKKFCQGLFGTSNLIGTDIEDVTVEDVEREFVQGSSGVRVSFTVSHDFIGKTAGPTQDALERLR